MLADVVGDVCNMLGSPYIARAEAHTVTNYSCGLKIERPLENAVSDGVQDTVENTFRDKERRLHLHFHMLQEVSRDLWWKAEAKLVLRSSEKRLHLCHAESHG